MKILSRAKIGHVGINITVRAKIPFVSPEWKYVLGLKNGSITEEQYKQWYLERLESGRDAVHKWTMGFEGNLIFLCYCKDGDFCHTYLLIDWLVQNWPEEFSSKVHAKTG